MSVLDYQGRLTRGDGDPSPFAHRSPAWRKRRHHELKEKPCQNVGRIERIVSFATGAALTILGLQRKSLAGLALAGLGGGLLVRGASGHCGAYEALGIDTSDAQHNSGNGPHPARHGIRVAKSILIGKPASELYTYWRNFENLPQIMSHLREVRILDDKLSQWTVDGPRFGADSVTWQAEIIRDEPGSRIAWRSLPESDVDQRGMVTFLPASGERGIIVHVELEYRQPAGKLGHWLLRLFGDDPAAQIHEGLRIFKRQMELGEVITVEGQPQGSCSSA